MLKNAYLDAKIGFDTAENEPSKVRGFLIGVGGAISTAETAWWRVGSIMRPTL